MQPKQMLVYLVLNSLTDIEQNDCIVRPRSKVRRSMYIDNDITNTQEMK